MSKRTPALIFDFGNVVAHFDYTKACVHLGRLLGISGEAFLERVRSLGLSPLAQQYESGKLSAEAFSQAVCALVGLELAHDQFASAWSDIFWLNEPIAPLVSFLKERGYTLVLGSNTNDLHAAQFRRSSPRPWPTSTTWSSRTRSATSSPLRPSTWPASRPPGPPPRRASSSTTWSRTSRAPGAAGLSGLVFRDVPTLLDDLAALGVEVPQVGRWQATSRC